jgi:hypothetical protein
MLDMLPDKPRTSEYQTEGRGLASMQAGQNAKPQDNMQQIRCVLLGV